MTELEQLSEFATNLEQEVIARADAAEDGLMRAEALTEILFEYLRDFQEIEDAQCISFEARGARCSGFHLSEDNDRLDLFLTIPKLDGEAGPVPKSEISTAFERLNGFLNRALEGFHFKLEEASDAWDMARSIHEARADISMVRLYVLTDGVANLDALTPDELPGVEVSWHVWDLRRFMRTATSGKGHEPVRIVFSELSDQPVQCIIADPPGAGYRCLLTIVNGDVLVSLYRKFGPRLLERNVRSFLQLKGGINKKIRDTILKEPENFLAYNNGLSVTASGVQTRMIGDGLAELVSVDDFQIVNGGQTTGSLFRAVNKDRADASAIRVQVKITEILPTGEADELAPKISQFSNAQNKINMADFSSNNPFHRRLENLSRTVWAPPGIGGGQRQTRWYYERARGQYNDDLAREKTPAKQKAWSAIHPRRQLVTKTDLAKFEQCWGQLPHIVSKGAQKCYLDFLDRLEARGNFVPEEDYFKRVIAKGILFRETDRIVARQDFGGYKANITAYTVALLSFLSEKRIDLDLIWAEQTIRPQLADYIERLSVHVQARIVATAGSRNISEWCKQPKCWEDIKGFEYSGKVPSDTLTKGQHAKAPDSGAEISAPTGDEILVIDAVAEIEAQTWYDLSAWAKETGSLVAWERGLAFSLGKLATRGSKPSVKQARHGQRILADSRSQGFRG